MTDFLKRIGAWFIGKSEQIEKLDEEVKAVVNLQTKRAFCFGAIFGMIVTMVFLKVVLG